MPISVSANSVISNSAEMLEGIELDGGWIVLDMIKKSSPEFSGGNFSKGYNVKNRHSGKIAFLKALDFYRAFQSPDFLGAINFLTNAYMFERNMLEQCKNHKMDRIVTPIAYGQVHPTGGLYPVFYFIFEKAEGDIRKVMNETENMNDAWRLRSIHQTAVALNQLHTHGMAHQDVKPSNVLVFKTDGSKLGDVGRSVIKGVISPHENLYYSGDPTYAPPELIYGYRDPEWSIYRLGCDFYLLGSHILFLFSGVGMTSSIKAEINPQHYNENWGGTYREVLPYLRVAYDKVINAFSEQLNAELRNELTDIVRQLCDPDIDLRGLSNGISSSVRFSLQRYISRFDVLARRAELKTGGNKV